MRAALLTCLVAVVPTIAEAGELDLNLGLQATTTEWPADHGGGGTLDLGFWFTDWIGATFLGKEHYAAVDERFMTYLSVNAAVRHDFGPVRVTGSLGLVHQHEETGSAIMEQPFGALFGIGDGIRHRAGSRTGVSIATPVFHYAKGAVFVALDVDATVFSENERGPQWMTSAGISVGATYDFTVVVK